MKVLTAVFAALVLASPGAWATSHQSHAQAADESMTDGEVRKVDPDAQKVTIRHGPLPNLDMPAMTMVFRVKDPAMLERMKAGAKIRFRAEKIGGAYTVTDVEDAAK